MTEMLERVSIKYKNRSEKFQATHVDYSYQYFNIYIKRLEQLHNVLATKVLLNWNDMYPIVKLRDLSETDYDSCVVIGTIFKDQKLKPSVLKQLAEAEQLVPQPINTGRHLTDLSDRVFLEDESQRYLLEGHIDASRLVTGVTIAVMGTEGGMGKFNVEEVCFSGVDNHVERPIFSQDVYVVFISGLDLAHSLDATLPLRVLMQWLAGGVGDLEGVETSKICRLVVAGNSISTKGDSKVEQMTVSEQLENVKALDRLLLDACQVVDVDLMPGENDPTSYVLPQRPLHHCILPLTAPYQSMHRVSNPYAFSLSTDASETAVHLLGTAGTPVRDIIRYSGGLESCVDALGECLRWGHLAPTCPDTLGYGSVYEVHRRKFTEGSSQTFTEGSSVVLPVIVKKVVCFTLTGFGIILNPSSECSVASYCCYPFSDADPFIIGKAPHVFFAGNQEQFETKLCQIDDKEVRLISIPEFAKTREVCVLNLRNLECFPICFDVVV